MTSPATESRTRGAGILTVSGYGLRVAVERGHLVVENGIAGDRETIRLPRVSPGLKRLIVLGHSGTVSLEALRWLHDVGIAFVQIDKDAEIVVMSTAGDLRDVKVRRGQSLAALNGCGLALARQLLDRKIGGQLDALRGISSSAGAREILTTVREALGDALDIGQLRYVESRAALAYWDAWRAVSIRFAERDRRRLPAHWLSYDARRSALSEGPRRATTPINALLNYLYAILEAEAVIAALKVGCDPLLGIIHADQTRRPSFAFDLMEPVRPLVDQFLLELLRSKVFLRSDFFEARDGVCRLMPELAKPLAATALQWAKGLAPIAEQVAGVFATAGVVPIAATSSVSIPLAPFRTPLTQANRTSGHRDRPKGTRPLPATDRVSARCRTCGVDLGRVKRTYCDVCLPAHAKRASEKAALVQRQLHIIGDDRRSSADVRSVHARNAVRHSAINAEWEATQDSIPSVAVYRAEIFPHLGMFEVKDLVRATGLSTSSCKAIRYGRMTPHPRHWDALRTLVKHR